MCFTPGGGQRGLAEVYKAGQTPWVELTVPSCFRESWGVARRVANDRGPMQRKSSASTLKANWANCGSLQDLEGCGEDLNRDQVKRFISFLIFTFLNVLMRFYLLRHPANTFRLVHLWPVREGKAGTFLQTFFLSPRVFHLPWSLWGMGVSARHKKTKYSHISPSIFSLG